MFLKHCWTHNLEGLMTSSKSNSPSFGHKTIKEVLLANSWSTSLWLKITLERKDSSSISAGRRIGSSNHVECIPEHVVNSRLSQPSECSWTSIILEHANRRQGRQALRIYEQMRKDGVEPSPSTFLALLKACSYLQDLRSTKQVHTEVVSSGFESDVDINTMLVDAYAKSRSLVDTTLAFEKMPHRDVVCWNAMITAYVQTGEFEQALHLYVRMQQEGVLPDRHTYVSILKACSCLAGLKTRKESGGVHVPQRILETVKVIHEDLRKGKFHSDVLVGNMLVDVYGKCGSLKDARCVFEAMPHRTVVSWNAIIFGYARMNEGEEALLLYTRMQQEGVQPDNRTYVSALKACSSLVALEQRNEADGKTVIDRCLDTVRAIHTAVVERHFESDVFVATMLVDVYSKCKSLEEARRIFDSMPFRTVVSWNAIIWGYAQMDKGDLALQLFTRMRQEGVMPNDRTYVSALKACSKMAESEEMNGAGGISRKQIRLDTVRAIHRDVLKGNSKLDVFVGNMLVDVYGKCGSLEDARCVFEHMVHRDLVSWNVMLSGYAQVGKGEEALQLYNRMQQDGLVPDGWTYLSILKACSRLAGWEEPTEGDRRPPRKWCLETLRVIHANITKGKLDRNVFVGNMLVDAYAKCEGLADSRHVFEEMPCRTVVSWNAMILGYAQMDEGEEALNLYTRMRQEGVVPNERTYVGVLKACGTVAGLEKGKEIHAQMTSGLGGSNSFLSNALIHMYGKCGSMFDAQQVFDALPRRDIVAWSALIAGYSCQGNSEVVFHLFQRMQDEGIQPNGITFLSVLTVCSHEGLVDTGQKYFKAMTDYGITPTITHFTCMVDLLGRSGQVDKAIEMVKAMPFQPDSTVWESILGACQKWQNVEFGRQAFDSAIRLDKDDAAAYALMSNIYMAANMLEERKDIQAMRAKSQAPMQPGQSRWTDMSGMVHVFVAGDRERPKSHEIYETLTDLTVKTAEYAIQR